LTYGAEKGFPEACSDHSDVNRGSQIAVEEFICIFHCFQIKLSALSNSLSRVASSPENVIVFRLLLDGSEGVKS